MKELANIQALEACLAESKDEPAIVFKHSTRCPISAGAHGEVVEYEAGSQEGDPAVNLVKVIEAREVSNAVAERLGVRHESPQVILVRNGKPQWTATHRDITAKAIRAAIGKHCA